MKNKKIEVKNLTKFYALSLLRVKEAVTGYYILKRLKNDLGRTASPTYIYKFLDDLKAKGYLEDVETPNSKKSKGSRLTPDGKKFVDKILNRFNNIIEAAIQDKIKVCSSCGVKLYNSSHKEIIDGNTMYFCCKHCAKAYKESKNHP
ncbi:MAG: helix-turn-helix transcriptional regulator [Promethearchaeia archaeon]